MLDRPLDDAEIDRLNDLLDALPGERAMNLEEMDGFFSGLHCAPAMPPMGQVIELVLGGGAGPAQADAPASAENIAEIMSLAMRHWNAVGAGLARGVEGSDDDVQVPLLFEDEAGVVTGNDWARGFWRATLFDIEPWRTMMAEPQGGQAMGAIAALAFEHDPDPSRRLMKIEPGQRAEFVMALSAGLHIAYRYFAPQRRAAAQAARAANTVVRDQPKVGRNTCALAAVAASTSAATVRRERSTHLDRHLPAVRLLPRVVHRAREVAHLADRVGGQCGFDRVGLAAIAAKKYIAAGIDAEELHFAHHVVVARCGHQADALAGRGR